MVRIKQIDAVHEKDMEEFLHSIGMLDAVKSGKIQCFSCGENITLENIECVFPHDEEVKFCCQKQECYNKVLELFNNGLLRYNT